MKMLLQKNSKGDLSTLVVFTAKDKKSGQPVASKFVPEIAKLLQSAQTEAAFTGAAKESIFFRHANAGGYANILIVGLGDASSLTFESIRNAGSVIFNALKAQKVVTAGIAADSLFKFFRDSAGAVQALVEGTELSDYEYNELKGRAKKKDPKEKEKPTLKEIVILTPAAPTAAQVKALQRAEILVECQNLARRLGDTPGNFMTPTILANEAVKAAKGTGLKVTVWDKARIEKERMGGLLAVARAGGEAPRFIIMEYKGAGAGVKPTVFVGKGLTFDTGGISLKPGAAMEEMKYDMCGGAAVIATLVAIARLKLKVNVVGLVPSTENMPGPDAFKPGDVYFARNGKSVEVFNTDAEGRLILGEALVYGSELKPAAMFDAATLTGAILIALGNTHTGVFTRDKKLMKKIEDAADSSGELVWSMPLTDWHVEDMKGTHADWCNISSGRLAGSATAAAFLEQFVEEGIPWAHFDIAGTAWNVANRFPYHPKKGASGIIMRTFVALAEGI